MDVVEVAVKAITVVDATNYITQSVNTKEAFKTASLLKDFNVNVLIVGESGTGRKTLATLIDKNIIPIGSTIELEELSNCTIYIEDIEDMLSAQQVEKLNKNQVRIIGITTSKETAFKSLFPITIALKNLKERVEDLEPLAYHFLESLQKELRVSHQTKISFRQEELQKHLSQNIYSLKKFVYQKYFMATTTKSDLLETMESYLHRALNEDESRDYRSLLYLYEVPLLKVAIKKFISQVQVANHLNINRNTLRKKLEQFKEYL